MTEQTIPQFKVWSHDEKKFLDDSQFKHPHLLEGGQ